MFVTQARIRYWRRRVCPYSRGRSVEVGGTWTACRKAVLVLEVLDGDWGERAILYTGLALGEECCLSLGVMAMDVEIAHRLNGGRILVMGISTKHTSTSVRQECQNIRTGASMAKRGGRRREARCLPASRAFGLISIVPARSKLTLSLIAKAKSGRGGLTGVSSRIKL